MLQLPPVCLGSPAPPLPRLQMCWAQGCVFVSPHVYVSAFCKVSRTAAVSSKFPDIVINFIRKMKPYGAINSKSGTKQQQRDTGLQYLALSSKIEISPISPGLCLMFTAASIPQLQPSGHRVNTPQYLLQLVFD